LTFTGDVTGSGNTGSSTALTLANSGATAGTYTKVTVDAKGRVTTGASLASGDLPTYTGTITSSQVTTALGYTPPQPTGTGASGTWGINITGNAATATSATDSTKLPLSGGTLTGGLHLGSAIGSRGTAISVSGSSNSSPIVLKSSGYATVFGILPHSSSWTYLSTGIYYDNGSWVHASADTNNALLGINGGSGVAWYASNNSTGSWNVAGGTIIWNSAGTWVGAVNAAAGAQVNGNAILHAGNYSSYALPLSGGELTGSIRINTSGSQSTTSHLILKRSGQTPASFGSYSGAWRSSLEIWNNDSSKMLFLNSAENDYGYGHIKSVNGGLVIQVGASGATNAIVIESSGTSTIPGTLQFTDTTNGFSKLGSRLSVRSESTDNVANFASYGLYLPKTSQTAGLYVESPIEARTGLRIGDNAGNGTITVGADTAATPNRLAQRDSGGDIYQRYGFAAHFNQSSANAENPSIAAFWTNSSSDNYNRKSSPAHVISQLGLLTTSNWTSYTDGRHTRKDTTGQYLKPFYEYGSYLTTETPSNLASQMGGGGLRVDFMHPSYTGSGGWNHVITFSGYNIYNMYQLGAHYDGGTGTDLWVRSEANHGGTSWTAWRKLLNSSNFGSYALPLSGGTVSGTVSINGGGSQPLNLTTSSSGPWGLGLTRSDSGVSSRVFLHNGSGSWAWVYEHNPVFYNGGSYNPLLHSGNFSSYALPLSGGTLNGIVYTVGLEPVGVGGNSGVSGAPYKFGYQEAGSWTHPYPDLIIGYHTGMKFGGNTSYGGMRFYADHPQYNPAELFSIGNGDSHVRVANNLYVSGASSSGDVYTTGGWFRNHTNNNGIYWSATGWHLYPASTGDFYVRSGTSSGSLLFLNSGGGGLGYVHAASDLAMGFLTSGGNWRFRVDNSGNARCYNNLYLDQNYGHGIVGVYESTRYQGVFAMGDSYKLPADGTSTGNLYGMAWSHPNAGGVAGNLDSHGMLVLINGGFGSCMSYSIKASGNVTAYSDERLKTNWRPMPENFVERLAQVRVGVYDRTDGEKITQVGIGAQSLQKLLPEAITKAGDEMGTLSVSYGNAAMASAVELAKELVMLKKELAELKSQLH